MINAEEMSRFLFEIERGSLVAKNREDLMGWGLESSSRHKKGRKRHVLTILGVPKYSEKVPAINTQKAMYDIAYELWGIGHI